MITEFVHVANAVGGLMADPSWDHKVDPNGLPGGNAFVKIVGGLKFYGLVAATAGAVISAMVFGIGRYVSHHYAAVSGRLGFFACLATAIIVGGAGQLVQWAFDIGSGF